MTNSANDVFGHFVEGLFDGSGTRKRFISQLVHHFITAAEFVKHETFVDPLVRYRVKLQQQSEFLTVLKGLVANEVILSPSVQHLEFKGQTMVVSVFEVLQADPKRLLPRDAYAKLAAANDDPRIICDHVAGMTDTYLLRTYERLFSPRMGSVFDKP